MTIKNNNNKNKNVKIKDWLLEVINSKVTVYQCSCCPVL